MENLFSLALKYFLVINAVTQAPFFASLVNKFDRNRQQAILRRELILAFVIGLFFLFIGGPFLTTLGVATSSVRLCGGIILVLIALDILFPHQSAMRGDNIGREPFLVPIAVPLLSGPTLMTTLMVSAKSEPNMWVLCLALFIAYAVSAVIVLGAPTVVRLLGKKGLSALERLLGMLLIMMGVEMLVLGVKEYMKSLG